MLGAAAMAAPLEHLRKVSLFADLDTAELTPIASLAQRRVFEPRAIIVQQADMGGELFVIVEGHVKVISAGVDGRDSALNIMGPGDVFGEVSLLDGDRREPFMHFLEGSPKTAVALLKVLTGLLRKLTERSEDVAFLRVGGRLAKRIAGIAERYGEKRADGSLRVPFKLSQQEIGDMVNATRESANKQLKAWEDSGLLSHDHGHLVVNDLERLRAEGGDI